MTSCFPTPSYLSLMIQYGTSFLLECRFGAADPLNCTPDYTQRTGNLPSYFAIGCRECSFFVLLFLLLFFSVSLSRKEVEICCIFCTSGIKPSAVRAPRCVRTGAVFVQKLHIEHSRTEGVRRVIQKWNTPEKEQV